MTGTATLIQTISTEPDKIWEGSERHQALYHLDPPIVRERGDEDTIEVIEYVIVSAVHNEAAHETYIFPGDEHGVTDFGELPGSFRGEMNHEKALALAGYENIIRDMS